MQDKPGMRKVQSAVNGISDHIFLPKDVKSPGHWACVVQWAHGTKLEGIVYYMPPFDDGIYEVGTTGSYLTEREVLSDADTIVHNNGIEGSFHLPQSMREYKALTLSDQPLSPAKPTLN